MSSPGIYLNHAGTSWPKPQAVIDAVQDATLAAPTEWPERFEEAHHAISEFFGVSSPDQILLTPGCTSALSVGIGDTQVATGQRVLTSRWEHHAVHRPLLKLAPQGIRLEYIPPESHDSPATQGPIDLNWLEQELSRRDVALIAITAVCNVTGELLPYEDVIRIAHSYGSMVLIDMAQLVGWRDLDLSALGADMVAFGGHKGLQAPWGIGGLYMSDEVRMECLSATCGLPTKGQDVRPPRPGYCDVGSVDLHALAGLSASIRSLSQSETDSSLATARQQVGRLQETLERIEGIRTFGPADLSQRMPTLAFTVGDLSSGTVAARLREHSIAVGSGLHCAALAHESLGTQDTGLVRISVGRGQSDAEIDEAADRLRTVLSDELDVSR